MGYVILAHSEDCQLVVGAPLPPPPFSGLHKGRICTCEPKPVDMRRVVREQLKVSSRRKLEAVELKRPSPQTYEEFVARLERMGINIYGSPPPIEDEQTAWANRVIPTQDAITEALAGFATGLDEAVLTKRHQREELLAKYWVELELLREKVEAQEYLRWSLKVRGNFVYGPLEVVK